jgi:hypothetical protein
MAMVMPMFLRGLPRGRLIGITIPTRVTASATMTMASGSTMSGGRAVVAVVAGGSEMA